MKDIGGDVAEEAVDDKSIFSNATKDAGKELADSPDRNYGDAVAKAGKQLAKAASFNPYEQVGKNFKPDAINVGSSNADAEMEAKRKALMKLTGY